MTFWKHFHSIFISVKANRICTGTSTTKTHTSSTTSTTTKHTKTGTSTSTSSPTSTSNAAGLLAPPNQAGSLLLGLIALALWKNGKSTQRILQAILQFRRKNKHSLIRRQRCRMSGMSFLKGLNYNHELTCCYSLLWSWLRFELWIYYYMIIWAYMNAIVIWMLSRDESLLLVTYRTSKWVWCEKHGQSSREEAGEEARPVWITVLTFQYR